MNVYGVLLIFLDVGVKKVIEVMKEKDVEMVKGSFAFIGSASMKKKRSKKFVFMKGVYFFGKVVWGKGYKEFFDCVLEYNVSEDGCECSLEFDVFGNGDDFVEVKFNVEKMKLLLYFYGCKDYVVLDIYDYKVFVNLLFFDVVVMMIAEALAMGKFVVCVKYSSNEFFFIFFNCFVYNIL